MGRGVQVYIFARQFADRNVSGTKIYTRLSDLEANYIPVHGIGNVTEHEISGLCYSSITKHHTLAQFER